MNSPIQHHINERECPGAPLKERRLTVCLMRKEYKRNLFPNTDKENLRPMTPPPREKPNGICHCALNQCTCCHAPKRTKKSNN